MSSPDPLDAAAGAPAARATPPTNEGQPDVARLVDTVLKLTEQVPNASPEQKNLWQSKLKAVRDDLGQSREIIVAFMGESGAGKSSVINAMLGEQIVPTSSSVACTSTPIQISYHAKERVDGELRFISRESWLDEMRHLLIALKEVDGDPEKLDNDDMGLQAWQRASALYPNLTGPAMLHMSAEQLVDSEPSIAAMLGSTTTFNAAAAKFVDTLLMFIRSHKEQVELWPLIASLSIRCKAAVLESGITLVDLPGVNDTNAARVAAAADYFKKADSIFVVARITRAESDERARGLMSNATETQLLNGKFNPESLAFIATYNDLIDYDALRRDIRLFSDPTLGELDRQFAALSEKKNAVDNAHAALRREIEELHTKISPNQCEDDRRIAAGSGWEMVLTLKRTRDEQMVSRRSIRRRISGGASYDVEEPISEEDKTILSAVDRLATEMIASERAVYECKRDLAVCHKRREDYCLDKRAEFTRNEIQKCFRKHMGHMANPGTQNPVVHDVPVCAVSALQYLTLTGKTATIVEKPPTPAELEHTGIPDLIERCRAIGRKHVEHILQQQIAQIGQVVGGMQSNIPGEHCGNSDDRDQVRGAWNAGSESGRAVKSSIIEDIERIVQVTMGHIEKDLCDDLFPKIRAAAQEAGRASGDFFPRFADIMKYWKTVKAALIRGGVFKSNDWNKSAIMAMTTKSFAAKWSQVLSVKSLMQDGATIDGSVSRILDNFMNAAPSSMRIQIMANKHRALEQVARECRVQIQRCQSRIKNAHAEISREMTNKMAEKLGPLYEDAKNHSGTGARKAALAQLRHALEETGEGIYGEIAEDTIASLEDMVEKSLARYRKNLLKIGDLVESHISPLWQNAGASNDPSLVDARNTVAAELQAIAALIRTHEIPAD